MLNAKDLTAAVERLINENAALKKQAEEQAKEKVMGLRDGIVKEAVEKDGVKVIKHLFTDDIDAALVKDLAFQVGAVLSEKAVAVYGSHNGGKPLITVMISKDLVTERALDAGKIVREAGKLIKGGGGGAPHFATAGGKDVSGIGAAADKVIELCGMK